MSVNALSLRYRFTETTHKKNWLYPTFEEGDLLTGEEGKLYKDECGENQSSLFLREGLIRLRALWRRLTSWLVWFFSFCCFQFHSTVSFRAVRKQCSDLLHYYLRPKDGRHEQHPENRCTNAITSQQYCSISLIFWLFWVNWGPQAAFITEGVCSLIIKKIILKLILLWKLWKWLSQNFTKATYF